MHVAEHIGPQSPGDNPITRRHRFHQSWYRAFVLGLEPGTGPRPSSTTTYDHRPEYLEVSQDVGAAFDPKRLSELTDARWNQLWRNQMLAEAVRIEEGLDHADLLVVHASPDDSTTEVVASYAEHLRRPSAVSCLTLSDVVSIFRQAGGGSPWLDAFVLRYVHLEASQQLFDLSR